MRMLQAKWCYSVYTAKCLPIPSPISRTATSFLFGLFLAYLLGGRLFCGWSFGHLVMIRSSVLATPLIVSIKVAPRILHLFSEFFAIVMQNTFLPYKSYQYHFQNCHLPFFLASSTDDGKANWETVCVSCAICASVEARFEALAIL